MADKNKDKRSYPQEVKEEALEAYNVVGSLQDVSRAMDIPPTTIGSWKDRGIGTREDEASSSALLLREMRYQKKVEFIEKAGKLADLIVEQMTLKVQGASFKDLAVSLGIVQDKIALAAGEATARTETLKSTDREELLKAAQEVGDKVKVLPKTQKKAV